MADIFYPDETYGESLARRTTAADETRRILARFTFDRRTMTPVTEAVFMLCASLALGATAAAFIPL
jgi:hypothetical protein